MDTYTAEEFAQKLKIRGYAITIGEARKCVKRMGKDFFTEDDFQEAYHILNAEVPVGKPSCLIEGENTSAPEHQRNLTRSKMAYQ